MTATVSMPLWLALTVGALAAWALRDRLLMRSARWFIRSRANRVLNEVEQRLKIHIRPFQQVSRHTLMSSDAQTQAGGRWRALRTALGFAASQSGLMLRSRWYRLGYACVYFGTPVSVRAYAAKHGIDFDHLSKEERQVQVAAPSRHLMAQVGRLIPVLPVPLVATVLLDHLARPISEFELKSGVSTRVRELEARWARIYVPSGDGDYAVSAGLRMLALRHLVDECDGLFTPRIDEVPLLRYYANAIAHLLAPNSATSY